MAATFVLRSNSRARRPNKSRKGKSKGYPKKVHFKSSGHYATFKSRKRSNGHRRARARRPNPIMVLRPNGISLRQNGISLRSNGIGFRKNGLIGGAASMLIPAAMGAVSLGVVHFALGYAPSIPVVGTILSYVEPVAYTVSGATLAGIAALIPGIPANIKAAFGGAAVIGGAAVDVFRYLNPPAVVPVVIDPATGLPVHGWGEGGMWLLSSASDAQGPVTQRGQRMRSPAMAGFVHAQ